MTFPDVDHRDAAAAVLEWLTASMPARRSEWRRAMRAELQHVAGRRARWAFVLGCGRATLTACVLEGRTMVSVRNLASHAILVAAGGGALMVTPLIGLAGASTGVATLRTVDGAVLFGVLWALAALAVFMASGLVASSVGSRSRRKWPAVLRVVVLLLAAGGWLGITVDQMPCFLGVPKCD